MSKITRYIQTADATWLDTPKDTIWVILVGTNIVPEDESLRTTPFGVDLTLLFDTEDECLFKPLKD